MLGLSGYADWIPSHRAESKSLAVCKAATKDWSTGGRWIRSQEEVSGVQAAIVKVAANGKCKPSKGFWGPNLNALCELVRCAFCQARLRLVVLSREAASRVLEVAPSQLYLGTVQLPSIRTCLLCVGDFRNWHGSQAGTKYEYCLVNLRHLDDTTLPTYLGT